MKQSRNRRASASTDEPLHRSLSVSNIGLNGDADDLVRPKLLTYTVTVAGVSSRNDRHSDEVVEPTRR